MSREEDFLSFNTFPLYVHIGPTLKSEPLNQEHEFHTLSPTTCI